MKVLLLTSSSNWGGTEIHTLALATTLAQRGHDVHILALGHEAFRHTPFVRESGVTLSQLFLPGPLRELGFWTWRRLLKRYVADIAIFPKGHVKCGSLALDLAARRRFPAYLTIEHLLAPDLGKRVAGSHFFGMIPGLGLWWYLEWLRYHARGRGPRRIICVSEAVRARLTQDYRWPARKLQVVHNGIDATRFRPDLRARSASRRQWGVANDAVVCGVVGRVAPEKGCEIALEAFKNVATELGRPDLHLVFVGDGPMASELQQTVQKQGLQERVAFAGRTDRPWEIYPAVDVLLMPSRVEGLPLGLLEAMACGSCPVAMGVGGIPEVITDPRLGWLIAAGDKVAFTVAVRDAVRATTEQRTAIGKRARAHVQEHFNAQVQFPLLASIIEEAAESRRSQHVRDRTRGRQPLEAQPSPREQSCSFQ
jgi:glycosyltransferase involved in cell wall biosynthesis